MSTASEENSRVVEEVKDYYGKRLQKSADLKTNVCVVGSQGGMSARAREAMKLVHTEVKQRYYGCGTVIPEAIEGCHILDLGCGSGVDVYVLSKLVGASGFVTGVDMTPEQLEIARRYIQYHADAFGFSKPNVQILEGCIEDLAAAGVESNSVDVIVSNCVVNLAADKRQVLAEAYRVLKDGGEIHFSDIYADQEVSEDLRRDPVLWGECISGALYWRRLHDLASEVGFAPPRLVRANGFDLGNPEMEEKLRGYKFVSATYRLFKVAKEKMVGDRFQVAYTGEILDHEESFLFDCDFTFPSGFVVEVDDTTASILMASRFKDEFEFRKVTEGAAPSDSSLRDPFQLPSGGSASACCSTGGKCC